MNPRRLVLLATFVGCLMLGGSVAWAAEVSMATLIGNLKSPDESVRLKAIDQLGARREGRRGRRSAGRNC